MAFCDLFHRYNDAYPPPVGTENWRQQWIRGYRRRRVEALEAFARHGKLRPDEWAVMVRRWDRRNAYRDLQRLQRYGYLLRKRDYWGRLTYQLSSRGAWWLSKNAGRW